MAFDETRPNLSASSSAIVNPPMQLLDFQPLAIYLNHILQAFNEFRLCGPLNLFGKVNKLLINSLSRLATNLTAFYKKEKASFDKNEHDLFVGFLSGLVYLLIPFLEKCLSVLFSHDQLQKCLSLSQADVDKLKRAQKIDSKRLLADLYDLVPVKKVAEVPKSEPVEIRLEPENDTTPNEAASTTTVIDTEATNEYTEATNEDVQVVQESIHNETSTELADEVKPVED